MNERAAIQAHANIRQIALNYAAEHKADWIQYFTSPACEIHPIDDEWVAVQVWVAVPKEELS